MNTVPDHFSSQAASYKDFRPTYPAALFDWLAQTAQSTTLAWDCGCGNGQASTDLARRFAQVVATDLSQKQLDLAPAAANIAYRREAAEQSTLAPAAVDLTFIAQALHWFDHDAFYAEVRRVSAPGACVAAVTYNLLQVSPEIDALIDRLYRETLNGYWPPGREHVENGYQNIPFPFKRRIAPALALHADWDLHQLLGYFESWSAVAAYRKKHGADPLAEYRAPLQAAWGDPAGSKRVLWPLTILAGDVD